MKSGAQMFEASNHLKQATMRKQPLKTSMPLSPQTDRTLEMKTKTYKSSYVTEQQSRRILIGSSPEMTTYRSDNEKRSNIPRMSNMSGQAEYFEDCSIQDSSHYLDLNYNNSRHQQSDQINYRSSQINSKQSGSSQVRQMKAIITQKDRCLRDMTQRLKTIMDQLDKYEIQSKANQCFSRLMTDLSRMFQIPDISIEGIRIQVSTLLEQRKSRDHSGRLSQKKGLEQIQHLIDKLNTEVNIKNSLQIRVVDLSSQNSLTINQNTVLKHNIQQLNQHLSTMTGDMRQLDDQLNEVRRQLEESNKSRKSGSDIMSSENKMLKVQFEKTARQREDLQVEVRELQTKVLDLQIGIVDAQERLYQQTRRKQFQQQQVKRGMESSGSFKEKLTRQRDQLNREFKESEGMRKQLEAANLQLRREMGILAEQKRLVQAQLHQASMSKEEIKQQLISQQGRIKDEYQHLVVSLREDISQLESKCMTVVEIDKVNHQETLDSKTSKLRLESQLRDIQRQIQRLNRDKVCIQQVKQDTEGRLQKALQDIETIRHQKEVEVDSKTKELWDTLNIVEEMQRQLRSKQAEIESYKLSQASHQESLERTKQHLSQQLNRQQQLYTQLQEQLRSRNIQLDQYRSRLEMLQEDRSNQLSSSQKFEGLITGEVDARKEAQRTRQEMEKFVQNERRSFQGKLIDQTRKVIMTNRHVEQLQININKMQSELMQNEQTIQFLRKQIESNQKHFRQLKDTYNNAQLEPYDQVSLDTSSTYKELIMSKEADLEKRVSDMAILILKLQEQVQSKEIVINNLGQQILSTSTGLLRSRSEGLTDLPADLECSTNKHFQVQIATYEQQIYTLKQQLKQAQDTLTERQSSQGQIVSKYQAEIGELKRQINSSQESIVSQSRLRYSTQSNQNDNHLPALNSQLSQMQEMSKLQQSRYNKLQGDNALQMQEIKALHDEAIRVVEHSYNQSRSQLVRQLQQRTDELVAIREQIMVEKSQVELTLKTLKTELEHRTTELKELTNNQSPDDKVAVISELRQQLEDAAQSRQHLELELQAFEKAVNLLQKQNMEQTQKFEQLKAKNLETSFSNVNDLNELFEREKDHLNISLQNKCLQLKTLESENIQLKLEVNSLRQTQTLQASGVRPRSEEYTKLLEEKTQMVRQLQVENSTLTLGLDDLRKETIIKEEKSHKSIRDQKDSAFALEKQNITLVSKVKVLQIKIDQLEFHLHTIKQLKSQTLIRQQPSLNLLPQYRTTPDIRSQSKCLRTAFNTPKLQTVIDVFKERYAGSISKQSGYALVESGLSHVGSKFNTQRSKLSGLSEAKPLAGRLFNDSQFYVDGVQSQSSNNVSSNKLVTTIPNRISRDKSIQILRRNSPLQQRGKEQSSAYFSNLGQTQMKTVPQSRKINNDRISFYSPDRVYPSLQSPRVSIQTARSVEKDVKTFNYSKVYEQSVKTGQFPHPIQQLFDKNKFFSTQSSGSFVESKTPYFYDPIVTTKIDLRQFTTVQKLEHNTNGQMSLTINTKGQELPKDTYSERPYLLGTEPEKGMQVYQKDCLGSIGPCC